MTSPFHEILTMKQSWSGLSWLQPISQEWDPGDGASLDTRSAGDRTFPLRLWSQAIRENGKHHRVLAPPRQIGEIAKPKFCPLPSQSISLVLDFGGHRRLSNDNNRFSKPQESFPIQPPIREVRSHLGCAEELSGHHFVECLGVTPASRVA